MLFNSLTRQIEPFVPVHAGEARVYTCGPTVYNYAHIGNMRAYVFADVLGRTLSFKGYKLKHVINITDVGHLTDDGDAGEDKLEQAAARNARTIWDIAQHYTDAFRDDVRALNIREPAAWSIATEYVPAMIAFAKTIAERHCYALESGLYFDVTSVADYGRLARAATDEGESRIDPVSGKRHAADFAIWRKTPPGETRQMEWDSPWGRGAPGWHLECSVMSSELLGLPFDIHTGGIDHREIHHPNEIAQNQAFCCTNGLDVASNSGANIWMHNNFLVAKHDGGTGKMAKSSGEFLRLKLLIDRGYHPLAYRLMCLQAHYRSELEFSWDDLGAALVRLKRLVMSVQRCRERAAIQPGGLTFEQSGQSSAFEREICDDLNTSNCLALLDIVLAKTAIAPSEQLRAVVAFDTVLGLDLMTLERSQLRLRPADATIAEADIEATLARRREARSAKDFAASDALRAELAAHGVEVMDGDPLGWDWKIGA